MTEQETPVAGTPAGDTAAPGEGAPATDNAPGAASETFTQSQVNDIVRERLARHSQSAYERYGVKGQEELDALIEHAKGYDALAESESKARLEVSRLSEELALLKTGVDEARYDDVRTWFKGKGAEITSESLAQALATHPEWGKARESRAVAIGAAQGEGARGESEDEIAQRYFGLKTFVK